MWLKKAAEARHVVGESLLGGLERPLNEAEKAKPGLYLQMLEMPELWATCQGESQTGSGTGQRGNCVTFSKAGRRGRSEEACT